MKTYEIIEGGPKTLIRCLICRHVSVEPEHVVKRYCPLCHRLHITVADDVQTALECTVLRARPDLPPALRAHMVTLMLQMLDPSGFAPPRS